MASTTSPGTPGTPDPVGVPVHTPMSERQQLALLKRLTARQNNQDGEKIIEIFIITVFE